MDLQEVYKRLEHITEHTGFYPKAVIGYPDPAKNYEKRDAYKEGYNDGVSTVLDKINDLLEVMDNFL